MSDFFKSKFFLAMVIITLVLVLVPSIFAAMGLSSLVRSGINVLLTPVQKLFHSVADAADGFASYFTDFDELLAENKALREENKALREQIYKADELSAINDWLYRYMELKRDHTDYRMLPASVTGRSSGNYTTLFTLDKGKLAGVAVNMPVLTEEGIVGYVTEVGLNWCKVRTLLEASAAIGVYSERSGAVGILEGDYSLSSENRCRLSYLDADADVKAGDRLLTSGYGSMYPRGLTVGTVLSVETDPYSRTPVAYVQPSAELTALERVMILTDYETTVDP